MEPSPSVARAPATHPQSPVGANASSGDGCSFPPLNSPPRTPSSHAPQSPPYSPLPKPQLPILTDVFDEIDLGGEVDRALSDHQWTRATSSGSSRALPGVVAEEDETTTGDESFDTDPVDRFFILSGFAQKLRNIQRGLRKAASLKALRGGATLTSKAGVAVKDSFKLGGSGSATSSKGTAIGEDKSSKLRRERRLPSSPPMSGRKSPSSPPGVYGRLLDGRNKVVGTLRDRQNRVVGRIRERHTDFLQKVKRRKSDLIVHVEKTLTRARSAQTQQARHIFCFVACMVDVVVTAFWLGRSPKTFHFYYTFKFSVLIVCRVVLDRLQRWQHYLFDLCYFGNFSLLLFLWVVPEYPVLFEGVFGLSGVLLLSVFVLRNSFVPHSLDKVTSCHINLAPALQLWVLRWHGGGLTAADSYVLPAEPSMLPAVSLYLGWSLFYAANMLVLRKSVDKQGYTTLYHYVAWELGMYDKLPGRLQNEWGGPFAFMVGHSCLFSIGLVVVVMPFVMHTACICIAAGWCFRNGAGYYVTYFWKVYETQIHAVERQMAQVQVTEDRVAAEPLLAAPPECASGGSRRVGDDVFADADDDEPHSPSVRANYCSS